MIDTWIDGRTLMLREITEQRFQEICTTHPELLEQRENVVLWKQEALGNPMEMRYLITLNGEEIAKFSVYQAFEGTKITVGASPVEYYPRK